MNYILLAMALLTVMPIVFGVLLGLLRGSRRALLRLILIVVCIVVAFALCGTFAKTLMTTEIQINGESMVMQDFIRETITSDLPESMAEFAIPLVQSILQIMVFLVLFFVLWFLTWAIVFPICKLFVKPRRVKDERGNVVSTKKHSLIGAVIGAVQGVIVAVCVCVVLTGLLVQTNSIMTASGELNGIMGESDTYAVDYDNSSDLPEEGDATASNFDIMGMVSEYADSGLAKMYDTIGAKPFARLSQVKLEDGTKITFPGQIEAVRGLVDIAKELIKLQDIDFKNLLTQENINTLETIFGNLDTIKAGMSDEARTTVNKLMTTLGDELGLADLNSMNITGINFQKEGEIFTHLYEYNNKDTSELTREDAESILRDIAQSDLILDMLQQQDDINLSDQLDDAEHREMIADILDGMEADDTISQEKIDALRSIFGLN